MWSKLLLCLTLLTASAASQAIDQNSNADTIQKAIGNDSTAIRASALAGSGDTHAASVYTCELLKNVVADTAVIMEDPHAAILAARGQDKLKKRDWLDKVLMVVQVSNGAVIVPY